MFSVVWNDHPRWNPPLGVFTRVRLLWPPNPNPNPNPAVSADSQDRPPVANGGQDRVVQPQDIVMLNGVQSKDDKAIVSYQWQMLTSYPYAIIEVMRRIRPDPHALPLVEEDRSHR